MPHGLDGHGSGILGGARDWCGRDVGHHGGEGRPMTRQTTVWVVYDLGGEWEDRWEKDVIAFDSYEDARRCAEKRCRRQAVSDDEDIGWDYCGSGVRQVQLVMTGASTSGAKPSRRKSYLVSMGADGRLWPSEHDDPIHYDD